MIAQLNLAQGIASAVDLLRPSSVQSNRASALNARHADRRKVLLKWIYIGFFLNYRHICMWTCTCTVTVTINFLSCHFFPFLYALEGGYDWKNSEKFSQSNDMSWLWDNECCDIAHWSQHMDMLKLFFSVMCIRLGQTVWKKSSCKKKRTLFHLSGSLVLPHIILN